MTPPLTKAAAVPIADAVTELPEVSRLSGGPAGAVATHLPGNRVVGVRIHDDIIEIRVVAASMTTPLGTVATRVRDTVGPHLPGGYRVDVFVDDIDDIDDTLAARRSAPAEVADPDLRPERGVWAGPERQPILGTKPASLTGTRPEMSMEAPS